MANEVHSIANSVEIQARRVGAIPGVVRWRTPSDVAVRYLCANTHPDHDSICAFRANDEIAFRAAFVRGLQLAQPLKVSQVGTVSVDGTQIQANASKHAAVSYQRTGELIAQLEREVNQLLERARQSETQENPEGLDLPAELKRREQRQAARHSTLSKIFTARAGQSELGMDAGVRALQPQAALRA